MSRASSRFRALLLLGACTTALRVAPSLRPGSVRVSADDPTSAVVAACAWTGWLLGTALLVTLVAATARHLPHLPAPVGRALTAVTPRLVRCAVDATIGAGAAAVVLAAPVSAYADTPPLPPAAAADAPAAVASLDWPGVAGPVRLVSPPPAGMAAAPAPDLVVRAGDSLWSLAARWLGPGASPAQVAAEWPRLYAANRTVIGPDPDLIHPGQRLTPPTDDPRSPR